MHFGELFPEADESTFGAASVFGSRTLCVGFHHNTLYVCVCVFMVMKEQCL